VHYLGWHKRHDESVPAGNKTLPLDFFKQSNSQEKPPKSFPSSAGTRVTHDEYDEKVPAGNPLSFFEEQEYGGGRGVPPGP